MAYSTTLLFKRGNVPGCPKDMGLIWVLGPEPKAAESGEKALLAVDNWACTSNPTTNSYLSMLVTVVFVIINSKLTPKAG